MDKKPGLPLKFDVYHTSGDTSDWGGHIPISGCPSMSNLFVNTFFEVSVVELQQESRAVQENRAMPQLSFSV